MNFEQDATEVAVTKEQLTELSEHAKKAADLEARILIGEALIVDLKKELNMILRMDIPGVLDEVGMKDFTLTDGTNVKIVHKIKASIAKINMPEAVEWLKDNGLGDIVKETVSVLMNKIPQETKDKMLEAITELGLQSELAVKVNANTLSATVREQKEEGIEIPEDLLGVYEWDEAKLTRKEKK